MKRRRGDERVYWRRRKRAKRKWKFAKELGLRRTRLKLTESCSGKMESRKIRVQEMAFYESDGHDTREYTRNEVTLW